MAKDQPKILLHGETFSVHYTCWRLTDPESGRTAYSGGTRYSRVPLDPVTAAIRLYDYENSVDVELEAGSTVVNGDISGNTVRYLIPSDKFEEGSYRVYTTFTFDDGRKKTEIITIRVTAE